MVKDRAIQRKIKGKVLAMAMTAVMASFFVPLGVKAEGESANPTIQLKDDNVITEIQVCSGTCKGHEMSGTTHHQVIVHGSHTFYLSSVNIDTADLSAFKIDENAKINLVLKDDKNVMKCSAASGAGIFVPRNATLTISDGTSNNTGKLNVTGGTNGAGIGGAGDMQTKNAGNIIIKGGDITAKGGGNAAGIGSNFNGTVDSIIIMGGKVKAIGGDGSSENPGTAAGIGCGTAKSDAGAGKNNVSILGGTVKALGGGNSDDIAPGIRCNNLTSKATVDDKSESGNSGVIITNSIAASNISSDTRPNPNFGKDFEGFIWMDGVIESDSSKAGYPIREGKICNVWGNAVLPPKEAGFTLEDGQTLSIMQGTLTIPESYTIKDPWTFTGTIGGNGKVINADLMLNVGSHYTDDKKITLTVKASADYVHVPEEKNWPTFDGSDLRLTRPELFTIDKKDKEYNYIVEDVEDEELYTCVIKEDGMDAEGKVINAGKYVITYTRKDGYSFSTNEFQVKPASLKNDCTISPIADKIYGGDSSVGVTLEEGELVIKLTQNGYQLKPGVDYAVPTDGDYDNNTDASRATSEKKATVDIRGYSNPSVPNDIPNFSDETQASFIIQPAPFTEEVIKVDFPDDQKGKRYDGTEIEVTPIVTDKRTNKVLIKDKDYKIDPSPTKFKDAGSYKITVTGEKNYEEAYSADYSIARSPLYIVSAKAAYDHRKYDATPNIKISELKFDPDSQIYEEKVTLDDMIKALNYDEVIAVVSSEDVGTYDKVISFENIDFTGDLWKNYGLGVKEGDTCSLSGLESPSVEITPADAPVIKLNGELLPDEESERNGTHNFSVLGEGSTGKEVVDPRSHTYYCAVEKGGEEPVIPPMSALKDGTAVIDGTAWVDGGIGDEKTFERQPYLFKNLKPNTTYTFYAFIAGTRNVATSERVPLEYTFGKVPRTSGPDRCELTYAKDPNDPDGETYILTITYPEQEGPPTYENGHYIYSFEGDDVNAYGNVSTRAGAEPGEVYTAYVKYNEDAIYEASQNGTPSEPVELPRATSEVADDLKPRVKNPDIKAIVNGNEYIPNESGNIDFYGEAEVNLGYSGKLTNVSIYYTVNGGNPTTSDKQYDDKAPIKVTDKEATIKALAVRRNSDGDAVAYSDVVEVKLTRAGEANEDPNIPDNQQKTRPVINKLTDDVLNSTDLRNTEFNSVTAVETELTKVLSNIKGGYTYQNVIVFDLEIQISKDGGVTYVPATEEDFVDGGGNGLPVEISFAQLKELGLPAEVTGATHNFVVSHMFSTTSEKLGTTAGKTEEPNVTKTESGISFVVKGTSPVAVAYAEITQNPDDSNPPNNSGDTNNPNDTNPPNTNNPDDSTNPDDSNNPDDPNNPNGNQNGDGTDAQNGDGTNGNGTTSSTDPATQGASDSTKSALSNIMPKTGDPVSFIPWIAAAVVCIGVIVGLAKKKGGKKKTPKKTTTKSTQKTKKKK